MIFLLLVQASRHSEAGLKPGSTLADALATYNEALAEAGVLVSREELETSASGIRISYPEVGGEPFVAVGPFRPDEDRMVAAYTMIDVSSQEEAIEWAMRMPDPNGFGEGHIELRQLKTKSGGY
ncbi:YciI family protein [Cohnella soli]|uniref:YciI family protein n=1 Tax=Cohnella soli TaxID=425005 RepID=A0ABW0HYD2_9BACL